MTWGFYGRVRELEEIQAILARRIWFFARITGRRRIGKTTLVQHALRNLSDFRFSTSRFRTEQELIQQANQRLMDAEGHGLEGLVAQLYEERSRKGLGDFPLTARIAGYWNRSDTEIDLVALNEEAKTLRCGTCKRNPQRLCGDLSSFDEHIARFLEEHRAYQSWTLERSPLRQGSRPQSVPPSRAKGISRKTWSTLHRGCDNDDDP